MDNKLDLIKELEKRHQEIEEEEYEKISKEMIGKFYVNKWVDQWEKERVNYYYVYKAKGRHFSGIEFNLGNLSISRVGHSLGYFEGWDEVESDKVIDIKNELINFWHLKDIFEGYF